jgi:hypothetical protein
MPSGTSLSASRRPGSSGPWSPSPSRQRTHAAVALVAAALEQLDARRFLGTGEQAADHHRRRTGGQRLADVAGVADAAVGDQRDAVLQRLGHHVDGGDLRHADAGDDARGADRARADADLDRVRAGFQQASAASPVAMLPPMPAPAGSSA